MLLRNIAIVALTCLAVSPAAADQVLYRYEGDVLPYDKSAAWRVFDPCEDPCSESLEDGHFVLRWYEGGDIANYSYLIAQPPAPPPDAVGRVALPLQPSPGPDLL